jgi:hypothetical protein
MVYISALILGKDSFYSVKYSSFIPLKYLFFNVMIEDIDESPH